MAHFTVYDKEYPMVAQTDFRFSDWALIREATGLGSEEFILAHGVAADEPVDKLVEFGYAAVAFWHGNPGMTRSRVGAAIEEWADADVSFTPDTATEDDAVPLDEAADGSTSNEESSVTSDASRNGAAEPSASTVENDGGQPGSPTGIPA